jgi:hypothetical protein
MTNPRKNTRDIYPPTGTEITAKSWLTEAPMRMLMNNLHPTWPRTRMSWWSMAASAARRAHGRISTASSPA